VHYEKGKGRLVTLWEPLVWAQCINDSNSFAVDADEFNWRLACMCIEDQYEFCNRKYIEMKPIVRSDIHYACVDAVHIMNVSIALSDGKIFYQLLLSGRTPKTYDTQRQNKVYF
jgi:hypothetical protein